ncbi:hypothetical protein AB6D40_022885 [Vibrio cyclitrophicus]
MSQVKTNFVALTGTLDLVTPPIAKSPSHAIAAENVQPLAGGGFGRIEGYEPVDGGPAPSEYTYYRLVLDSVSADWVGGTVELNGDVGHIQEVEEESQSLRVAAVSMVMPAIGFQSATVTDSEQVEHVRQVQALARMAFGSTASEQANYLAQAQAVARELVQAPLGDGVLRGVVDLDGQLVAFRDDVGSLSVSVANDDRTWSSAPDVFEVSLKSVLDPDAFYEGAAVAIDGVQASVLASSFSADGQTGFVYLDTQVSDAADLSVTVDAVAQATTSGSMIKASYSNGKPWQFVYHNFYGGTGSRYAYGTNGEAVVEVRPNGVVIPIPIYESRNITSIEVHRNHLFVSFEGGQLGHSAVGEPLNWEILLGAEQFGVGDEITALQSLAGGYLLIGCKSSMHVLKGNTASDWVLGRLSSVGVTPGTLTSTFKTIAHSDNGFIDVVQTEAFGDFSANELNANALLGDKALSSRGDGFFAHSLSSANNQVRFYQRGVSQHVVIQLLSDGSNRATFFSYPKLVEGVWDCEGGTYLAFGDGFVYRQNQACHSFSGEAIQWLIRLAYSHVGSPSIIKSWDSFELQMESEGSLELQFSQALDYGDPHHAQSRIDAQAVLGGGGRWDESDWDGFFWSSADYVTPIIPLNGHSRNVSILLSGKSAFEQNFRLDGYTLSYIPRRRARV